MKNSCKRILIAAALLTLACVHHSLEPQGPSAEPGAGIGFYFVQITDTHFGDGDHAARTRKLVDQINGLPYDIACVVHTGDIFADNITDAAVREEGLGVLKRLKAPCICCRATTTSLRAACRTPCGFTPGRSGR